MGMAEPPVQSPQQVNNKEVQDGTQGGGTSSGWAGSPMAGFCVVLVSNAMVHAERRAGTSVRGGYSHRDKGKGFDGVDFSYDLFGDLPVNRLHDWPSRRWPRIRRKNRRSWPSNTLLKTVIHLECRTNSSARMTKGGNQPSDRR